MTCPNQNNAEPGCPTSSPAPPNPTPQQTPHIKIRAEIEITCFGSAGIDGIKAALLAGEANSTAEWKITARLKGSPQWYISLVQTPPNVDVEAGIELLAKCLGDIEAEIKRFQGGGFVVRVEPKVVGRKGRGRREGEEGRG